MTVWLAWSDVGDRNHLSIEIMQGTSYNHEVCAKIFLYFNYKHYDGVKLLLSEVFVFCLKIEMDIQNQFI